LTAEKFTANPFSQNGQSRPLSHGRHGALSRRRQSEFLGRADDSIKIRSCRVELCEIESDAESTSEASPAPNGSIDWQGYLKGS
jgi:non-ribosomal peptide synthetase component F